MLQQTPMKTFAAMPVPAREAYVRCVVNGDVDGPAQFPLSTWLKAVKTDVVRTWITTRTRCTPWSITVLPTAVSGGVQPGEGWVALGPNSAAPFEYNGDGERGSLRPARMRRPFPAAWAMVRRMRRQAGAQTEGAR